MALIKNFSYTLAANERLPIQRVGDFVRVLTAATSLEIAPEDTERVEVRQGIGVKFDSEFTFVALYNGATPQTVELYVGSGTVDDARLNGAVNALIEPGSTGVNTADVTIANAATNTIAANGSRRKLVVGALSTNTGSLRAGFNVGATTGVELQPGLSYTFESTAAIKIYNGTGANQNYWVQEES